MEKNKIIKEHEEEGVMPQAQTKSNSDANKSKRKRRSKHEREGRNFICEICDKSYLSQPALNNHKNTKHSIQGEIIEKRARGRPRKYAPSETKTNEEDITRFNSFFNKAERTRLAEDAYNISDLVKLIFDDIFVKYNSKCYNQLMHFTDNPILNSLFNDAPTATKEKSEKTCDDIFYEYITYCRGFTNKNYLILVIKFVLLFRECMNISRQNFNELTTQNWGKPLLKKEYSYVCNAETAPDLCNEFVTEFLENNDYFGIESEKDRAEIIELIQHFCTWLYLNGYTQSRLSRIS